MSKFRTAAASLFGCLCLLAFLASPTAAGTSSPYQLPTWWDKAQRMLGAGSTPGCGTPGTDFSELTNIDISNELTPQSETSIAINPNNALDIAGGSNEIVCLPMRAYSSTTGGGKGSWTVNDLPLPAPISTNGQDFGSDPGLAWDTLGNIYYSYIVVFFNRTFHAVQGSEMAVGRSSDKGQTWTATFFNLNVGNGKFNDKPMIAVDTNPSSPHLNTVYVAWDNASPKNGKSADNDVVLVSHSTDHGATFSDPVAASPSQGGPAAVIGADPFVAPNGTLFVAWQDSINPAIRVAASHDGGNSFGAPSLIAATNGVFQVRPPAQALRGALVYPACAAATAGSHVGRLYCSWSDSTGSSGMDVFVAHSDNGTAWSAPIRVNDDSGLNDQFNQWLATDTSSGKVVVSWNDSRNDPTRKATDVYLSSSSDGSTFAANVKVTTAPTDETCCGADLGNQYGDYEGVAAAGGLARPIWTDRRGTIAAVPNLDEEIFTASITIP